MSYPVPPPPAPTVPMPAGRPVVVSFAAIVLWVMAGAGLIYAIVTVAIVPGTLSRFRTATTGAVARFPEANQESYIAVVWLGAAIALAVAVILFALCTVLGIALRRGSNTARIVALVICGLGALAGLGAAVAVAIQRGGADVPGSLGELLTRSYPPGWLAGNVALAVLQVLLYAVVASLVLAAPRSFFRGPGRLSPGSTLRDLHQYGGSPYRIVPPPPVAPFGYGGSPYRIVPPPPVAPFGHWYGAGPAYPPPMPPHPHGPVTGAPWAGDSRPWSSDAADAVAGADSGSAAQSGSVAGSTGRTDAGSAAEGIVPRADGGDTRPDDA